MRLDCFRSESPEKRASREIEKKLAEWYSNDKKAIKILLLGTGEAGKTTIIKQMKILHISGFTESERKEKANEIRGNVHEAIYDLVTHCTRLVPSIDLDAEENELCAGYIRDLGPDTPSEYSEFYFEFVEKLWNDRGIQECYQRSNEFQLIDSTKYFMDRINVVAQPNYSPSDDDILHCRKMTTVIQKVEFSVQVPKKYGGGSQQFWMFDVGGQRGFRRKWIQVFSGIEAILFLVASSDFDLTLREEEGVNRLSEALSVFSDVWNSRFLQDSGFILFLNKQDVLQEKVMNGKNIGQYFPEYKHYQMSAKDGDRFDEYIKTKCFIRDLFVAISKQRPDPKKNFGMFVPQERYPRELYHHFTIATDTNNIKKVFDDVHTIIIMHNLETVGIE